MLLQEAPEPFVDVASSENNKAESHQSGEVETEIDTGVSVKSGREKRETREEGIEESGLGIKLIGISCAGRHGKRARRLPCITTLIHDCVEKEGNSVEVEDYC